MSRLSSGSRIMQPADDAAGLAVSTKLDAQIHRIQGARANVSNATSFVQTQDGYLKKIGQALDRMSELSILAQDATKSDNDRTLYNKEFTELKAYINTASTKEFNGVSLFSSNALSVTVDSEGGAFTMVGINMGASPYAAAIDAAAGVSTVPQAQAALTNIKAAISQLANDRATIGAYQARLAYSGDQLAISRENLMAATSLHQGRRRRRRIHRVRQGHHPRPVRHRHARPGQPDPPNRPSPPPVGSRPSRRLERLDFDPLALLRRGCFVGPQPMWRRDLHQQHGRFDATMVPAGDYEFWLRLAAHHRSLHVPQTLGLYLESPSSVEHRNRERAARTSTDARRPHEPAIPRARG
ncbi:MAG: hypothetical protein M5U12_15180 [Verrucomicrobia bacterium]|nr:hypothetical protein [Verrucomicrobiota bacterium]